MTDPGAGIWMMMVYTVMYLPMVVGCVIGIVALWKLMRAHERMARILGDIAAVMNQQAKE